MPSRKRSPPPLRERGSLEVAGFWFENVAVVVDRAASQAHGAAVGAIIVDEASARVLVRHIGQPALLSLGTSVAMEVALAADAGRPGRFVFQALLASD